MSADPACPAVASFVMDLWAAIAEERASILETFEGCRRGERIFVPKGRPTLRWVATDLAWTHGTGDEVQGTMADVALAASGRGARVDALTGPGQPALASWLRR